MRMTVQSWKMAFGFATLLVLAVLAMVIALGKVEESTSYGLPFVLGGLTTMAGGLAQWAFGNTGGKSLEDKDEQ